MVRLLVIVGWMLVCSNAWAAQLYVELPGTPGCVTPVATNYDPVVRSCGSNGMFTVYSSPDGAVGAMANGDQVTIRGGYYTGLTATIRRAKGGIDSNTLSIIEGEPSDSIGCALAHTCKTILHPTQSPSGAGLTNNVVAVSHAIIQKIDFDHQGITTNSYPFRVSASTQTVSGSCTDVTVRGIETHSTRTAGSTVSGIMIDGACDHILIDRVYSHDNGNLPPSTGGHGIYLQGDQVTVQNSRFANNGHFGIQCYRSGTELGGIPHDCAFISNMFENNVTNMAIEGTNPILLGNVFRNSTAGTEIVCGYGTCSSPLVYNNLLYNASGGAVAFDCGEYGGCTNLTAVNNIFFGFTNEILFKNTGTALLLSHNACEAAKSCGTTGKLSIAAITDILVSTTDYSLKLLSPAINAGTTSIRPCNDSACDIGPNEAFFLSGGNITGTTVEATFAMNLNTPLVPTIDGWSINCTPAPTACPASTPVISLSLKPGSSSVIVATYTGAACSAGQQWTLAYNFNTGLTTDSNSLPIPQRFLSSGGALILTNNCTGASNPTYPTGALLYYPLDGNAADASGNHNDGTLTGSPAFVGAKHGLGMQTTAGATQFLAMPYGNGIDLSVQPLTVCVGVNIAAGSETTANFIAFGSPVGTNQRFYVALSNGTVRLAAQSQNSGTASDLSVVAGWNFICVVGDGAGHLTLYNNNTAATSGSGVRTVTSYTLAGNIQLGSIVGNTSGAAVYDEFLLWNSVQSVSAIYAAWNPSVTPTAMLTQQTHQHQAVYLYNNAPLNFGALAAGWTCIDGGAIATIFQVRCEPGPDCGNVSFVLLYSLDQVNYFIVPNSPTTDGISFWGESIDATLNSQATSGPLIVGLAHRAGPTLLTADAVPVTFMFNNTTLTQRYIIRFAPGHSGQTYYLKLYDQLGNAFGGTYNPPAGAPVTIVPPMGSVGFY